MKPIKKFSTISDETSRIMESLKEAHGPALLDIVKKLGYNSLEEISKQKSILTKLESLLKEIPGAKEVSEDEAEDIEDEVVKKGTPKDVSDKAGEKEEDEEPGASNKVEEDDAEEIEAAVVKKGTPKSLEDKEGEKEEDDEVGASNKEVAEEESKEVKGEEKETPKATRKIMTFEDFVKEDETVNKNVNYNDDEDDEDNAELDAASADPLAEEEQVDASGLAIPLEIGNGDKTAKEIEDEIVAIGEPEKHNDAEGETLVTKDQTVASTVVGQSSVIKSFAAFIKESEVVGASGLAIPLVTGDGDKTAKEIEDETVNLGKPAKLKDEEGEVYVTTDQEVTEDPKTSKNKPANVVVEGKLTEAEKVSSDAEFKEYATNVLKKAFGSDFDEAKATEVIDGLTSKYKGDFGAMVGALTSSLGESAEVNEVTAVLDCLMVEIEADYERSSGSSAHKDFKVLVKCKDEAEAKHIHDILTGEDNVDTEEIADQVLNQYIDSSTLVSCTLSKSKSFKTEYSSADFLSALEKNNKDLVKKLRTQ